APGSLERLIFGGQLVPVDAGQHDPARQPALVPRGRRRLNRDLSPLPTVSQPANPGGGGRDMTSEFRIRNSETNNAECGMQHKSTSKAPSAIAGNSEFRIPNSEFQPPLLLLEHVTKWYGPVIGVNQVTLELHSGIIGLVGANGSGKTTLLRLAT